jgi:hypothetical protein
LVTAGAYDTTVTEDDRAQEGDTVDSPERHRVMTLVDTARLTPSGRRSLGAARARPPAKSGARLDALRVEFAKWLISPERAPRTQREWASEHGVAEQTLSVWKNAPDVKAVLESWRESFKPAFAEVVAAMFEKARRGDVQAARLVGLWLGVEEQQRTEHQVTRVAYVEPDALRAHVLRLEQKERAQHDPDVCL